MTTRLMDYAAVANDGDDDGDGVYDGDLLLPHCEIAYYCYHETDFGFSIHSTRGFDSGWVTQYDCEND